MGRGRREAGAVTGIAGCFTLAGQASNEGLQPGVQRRPRPASPAESGLTRPARSGRRAGPPAAAQRRRRTGRRRRGASDGGRVSSGMEAR